MEPRFTSFWRAGVSSFGVPLRPGHSAPPPGPVKLSGPANDTDATIGQAVFLGATVIDGQDDSSFGRLATLADPTGAMFKIVAGK